MNILNFKHRTHVAAAVPPQERLPPPRLPESQHLYVIIPNVQVLRISANLLPKSYTPPVTRRQSAAAPYTTHLEGWQIDILRRASRKYPYESELAIRKPILASLARRAGTIPKIVSVSIILELHLAISTY